MLLWTRSTHEGTESHSLLAKPNHYLKLFIMQFNIKCPVIPAIILSCAFGVAGKPIDGVDDDQLSWTNRTVNFSSPSGSDVGISSGCSQSSCPDFEQGIDMLREEFWDSGKVDHYLRVKHEGSGCVEAVDCRSFKNPDDNCAKFKLCGKQFEVCIDRKKMRAHRYIDGKKSCFTLETKIACAQGNANCAGKRCTLGIYKPSAKLDKCTW
jgi:hypothetical protein